MPTRGHEKENMLTPIEKPTSNEMSGAKLMSNRTRGSLQVLTYLLRRITSETGVCLSPARVIELHLRPGTSATWWQRYGSMNLDRDINELNK